VNEALLKRYKPKEQAVLSVPETQMSLVRFSGDGQLLLTAGWDGQVHRWRLGDGEPAALPAVAGHGGWVTGLVCHPSQQMAYSADSWGKLQAWDSAAESPQAAWSVAEAHDGWIQCLAISADGKLLATCGNDGFVRVWNAADGKLVRELPRRPHPVYSVAFHPAGESLVSGDLLGKVVETNLADGQEVRTFDAGILFAVSRLQDVGGVRYLTFDRDGKTLAAAGTIPSGGGTVQGEPCILLFDWADGKQLHKVVLGPKNECYVHELILHEEGFIIAVTSGTPGSGRLTFTIPGEEKPFFVGPNTLQNCHSVALHPDGQRLVVISTSRGSNGNGRPLKDGKYLGNHSPVTLMELGAA